MRGPTAAAALLVLSLMLPMTQGVTLSHLFTTRHASPDHSGPARMIRGVPSAARLEPGKREGSKISRRNTESFGPLALLDVCYMADDCTPGLYVVSEITSLLRSIVAPNVCIREQEKCSVDDVEHDLSTASAAGAGRECQAIFKSVAPLLVVTID